MEYYPYGLKTGAFEFAGMGMLGAGPWFDGTKVLKVLEDVAADWLKGFDDWVELANGLL